MAFVTRHQRPLIWLALALLALNAMLALGRSATRVLSDQGGVDFHSYWYYGHFLWQGDNPYAAYLARVKPELPVRYLDGVSVTTGSVAQPGLARTPANTAPIVLLLAPLARLSWPTAKLVWFGLNLALFLAFPWLVVRLWPNETRSRLGPWFLALAFYGFQGSRVALWIGQTTILALFLMTLSVLWRKRHPWLAGVCLGVALSKYSLALPVFVLLLAQRHYRPIIVSLAVQLAGLLAVGLTAGEAPLITLEAYGRILSLHTTRPGIHLGDLFCELEPVATWISLTGTLALLGMLVYCTPKAWRSATAALSPAAWAILSALSTWTLLAAYHRVYDTVLAIYFMALVLLALEQPASYALREGQRVWLAALLAVFVAVLSLPGEVVGAVLPDALVPGWVELAEAAITVAVLVGAGTSIWLLCGCRQRAGSSGGPY